MVVVGRRSSEKPLRIMDSTSVNASALDCPTYTERDLIFLDKFAFWVEGVLLVTLAAFGIFGNIFASVIISRKEMRNSFNLLLVSLACFDTFYLIGSILESFRKTFYMASKLHIILFPHFLYPFNQMAISGSILMTVAIAWERYIAVHYPLDYNQAMNDSHAMRKRLVKYVGPVFLLSFAFNIVKFFEATVSYEPSFDNFTGLISYDVRLEVAELRTHPAYSAYNNWSRLLVLGIVPFLLLVFFNTKIYNDILERRRRRLRINRLGRPTDSNVMTEFVSFPQASSIHRRGSSLSLKQSQKMEFGKASSERLNSRSSGGKNNNESRLSWKESRLKSWKRSLSASARRCCSPRMDSTASRGSGNWPDSSVISSGVNAPIANGGVKAKRENSGQHHSSHLPEDEGSHQMERMASGNRRKAVLQSSRERLFKEHQSNHITAPSRDHSVKSRASVNSELITTSDVLYLRRNGSKNILAPSTRPSPLGHKTLETSFGCSGSLCSTTASTISPPMQEMGGDQVKSSDMAPEELMLDTSSNSSGIRFVEPHRGSGSLKSALGPSKFRHLALPPELVCLMPSSRQGSPSGSICSRSSNTLGAGAPGRSLVASNLAHSASSLVLHSNQPSPPLQMVEESDVGTAEIPVAHLNHRLHRRRVHTINERRRRFEDNLAGIFMGFVMVFLVCHSPRLFLNIHELITIREAMLCTEIGDHGFSQWSLILISISHVLLVINSSINILIYCLLSSKFREECAALFRKYSRRHGSNVVM